MVFYTKSAAYTAKREGVIAFEGVKEGKWNWLVINGEPIQKNDDSRPLGTEAALFHIES